MWGLRFVGLLAPRPRQHGMLHPKLRLTAQKKSNEKKIFCSVFSQKICASFMPERASFGIKRPAFTRGHGGGASPHIRRPSTNVRKSCAERTMGVALPLPGCGGGISPHIQKSLRYFLKIISTRSYARKSILWDTTSTVARGVRRATLQNKSPRILRIRGRAVNEMRYENSIKKRKMQSLS